MKRLNNISFASRAMCIGIVILTILATACKSGGKYVVYHYDNGDDYFCEGLQRIVDQNGKIGFHDSIGKIVIAPRYAFAFPFKEGYAKVTDTGHMEAVDKAGEYNRWVSDSWYYIDKVGKKHLELIEICGIVRFSDNNELLKDAIITNNRTEKSALSNSLGRFRVLCEKGDSLSISYVGLVTQTIPANPMDSTEWIISMQEYGPIIEPMLQASNSTNDKLKMAVVNPENARGNIIETYTDLNDGSTLTIDNRTSSGSLVNISLFRLTDIDGSGKVSDGILKFTATDAAGQPIGGRITFDGDTAHLTFTESTWEYLPIGTTYSFVLGAKVDCEPANPVGGRTYSGYGKGGGLTTNLTIKFDKDGKCQCTSDFYQAFNKPVTVDGTYSIRYDIVKVHCQPEGFDSPIVWNFEIINDGQELGFNYSDTSEEGSIGTDWLQLKAK